MQTVVDTSTGWMIQCPACKWHEIPKKGKPGASWTFDGNYDSPTFSPSMNECINPEGPDHRPDVPMRRCHFVISEGRISFCGDCTHDLKGQSFQLEPWPEHTVAYYAAIKAVND